MLAMGMDTLVFIIKALAVCLVALMLGLALRREPASNRHLLWCASLLMLLLLPLFMSLLPQWHLPVINESQFQWLQGVLAHPQTSSFANIVTALYLLVALVLFLRLLASHRQVHLAISNAHEITDPALLDLALLVRVRLGLTRQVRLLASKDFSSPATYGCLRPVVLLPANSKHWSEAHANSVLLHELGHIYRHDWLTVLLSKLVCFLYWPIPLVWVLLSHVKRDAEHACDDLVILSGADNTEYASHLLASAKSLLRSHKNATLAMSPLDFLTSRMESVLDSARFRIPVYPSLGTTYVAFFALLLAVLAAAKVGILPTRHEVVPTYVLTVAPKPATRASAATSPTRPPAPAVEPAATLAASTDGLNHVSIFSDAPYHATFVPTIRRIDMDAPRPNTIKSPVYPEDAWRRKIEGQVIIRYDINAEGLVENPEIIAAQPEEIFNDAALNAIKGFKFIPARVNGIANSQLGVKTRFSFTLQYQQVD